MSDEITIRHDLRPGDLGRLISLHGEAYDHLDGYGLRFEAFVGQTVAEFMLGNDGNGRIWFAEKAGILVGCAAIVLREGNLAQLRWVVVAPAARGQRLGSELMGLALEFARENDSEAIILDTTDGLPESQTMYEKLGFIVISDSVEELWDGERALIRMRLDLA